MESLRKLSLYIFYGIIIYVPFHVFVSTWIGSSLDILDAMKAAKDIVMFVGCAVLLLTAGKGTIKKLLADTLTWLIIVYAAITLALAIIRPTDQDAETIAVVFNLRFLLFFVYARVLSHLHGKKVIKTAVRFAVIAGVIVSLLGILQVALLPNNALENVGYSRANGTPPVFYISDKHESFERAYATIKDPNSLGSYLIVVSALVLLYYTKVSRRVFYGLAGAVFACLILAYSRSAWIGFAAAATSFVWLWPRSKQLLMTHKKILVGGAVTIAVVTGLGLFAARNSALVQNLVLHVGDDAPTTSNSQRVGAMQGAVTRIYENPIGHGPGTAGPTSLKNDIQGPLVPENYYLQIGNEVGVLGLMVFVSILFVVGRRLARGKQLISVALLASFVGLAATNMLVHIWFNDAVSYTWWGLAGLVIGLQRQSDLNKK